MALITAEAEYVVACSTSCEVVWLWKLLSDLFDLQMDATCIHCDIHSCVKLLENPMFHEKSNHIEIKYHYIRYMVQRGVVKLQYVAMEEHIADVLIKPLARVKIEYFRDKLSVLRWRFPPKGSDESVSHSDMVKGLVPSMVRCKCRDALI